MESLFPLDSMHVASATVACVTIFLAWAIWAVHNHFFTKPLRIMRQLKSQGVPGYPFRPFVGQLPEVIEIRNKREKDPDVAASTSPLQFIINSREKFSKEGPHEGGSLEHATNSSSRSPPALVPAWFFSLGPTVRVLLHDPALVREALVANSRCFRKSPLLQKLRLMGAGLLSANGPLWRWQRRLINPAFSHREIKMLYPTMVSCTDDAMSNLTKQVGNNPGQPVNAELVLSRLTLDIICRSAFGSELEEIFGETMMETFTNAVNECLRCGARVLQYMFIFPYFRWLPLAINKRLTRAENMIMDAMRNIIAVRLAKQQEKIRLAQPLGDVIDENQGSPSRIDLLALMMSATEGLGLKGDEEGVEEGADHSVQGGHAEKRFGKVLSPQLLLDNSMTFLLAGHETTAQLLTWASFLLSQHLECQDKARAEVDALFSANHDVAPSFEQLSDLKVVSSIILESLRLYPPASAFGTTCVKTVRLSDALTVPAGADIIIPVSAIHVDKELWGEDAEDFMPDRFANGISKAAKHPSAFIPFSLGPRNCIGQNFALAEAKVILAFFLRQFTWQLSADYVHHPDLAFTLRPKNGMPLILTPRDV